MRPSVLLVEVLAVRCVLFASSAPAQFANFREYPWQGSVNSFYSSPLVISSVTFTNSEALIYDASTWLEDTGPLFGRALTPGVTRSGNYYYEIGAQASVRGNEHYQQK